MRRIVAITSLIVLAGCRETPPPPPLEYVVDTVGTVERVTIRGIPPAWKLTELYSVGAADTGNNSFGRVRSVLVDSSGALWVADGGDVRILRFTADGTPLTPLGRSGAGPGEYREPYSIVRIQDGLAVLDPMGGRVGLYGIEGGWAGQLVAPRLTGGSDIRLYPVSADRAWMMGYDVTGEEIRKLWIAVPGTGTAADTIAMVPALKGGPAYHTACQISSGGLALFSAPFAPSMLRVPLDRHGSSVAVDESGYRLTFVGPGGDTIRIAERDVGALPITDEEWAEGSAEYTEFRSKHPDAVCEPAALARPATKNAILGLWGTADGRLWVHARTADGEVFDVYSRAGRLMGSMPAEALADDAAPSAIGDLLALPARDGEGRAIVTVYRVERPAPVRDATSRGREGPGLDRPTRRAPTE